MIKIVFDNEYTWCGGFGCWFKSAGKEKRGAVRCIRGKLFYAYSINSSINWFGKGITNWCPVEDNTLEAMYKFKSKVTE